MRGSRLVLGFCVGLGCLEPTEVFLTFTADDPACAAVASRGVQITAADSMEYETSPASTETHTCQNDRVGSLVAIPSHRTGKVGVKITLDVLGKGKCTAADNYEGCIVARRIVSYIPHTRLDLKITLESDCLGVACDPASTCYKGQCVDAQIDLRCTDLSCNRPVDAGTEAARYGKVLAVAAGGSSACASFDDGTTRCWGDTQYGQLATPGTKFTQPTVIPALQGYTHISLGRAHGCGIDKSGVVRCWGRNAEGELGNGGTTDTATPTPIANPPANITGVYAGAAHACVVAGTNLDVYCWGAAGRVGASTVTTPTAMNLSLPTTGDLALGDAHSCARQIDVMVNGSKLVCWGFNDHGEIGQSAASLVPVAVTDAPSGFHALATGTFHTCVANPNETQVHCWGDNSYAQLGVMADVARHPSVTTTSVAKGSQALALGRAHSCALNVAGGVECWGSQAAGQLGNGTIDPNPQPTHQPVMLPFSATGVAAGDDFTCAWNGDHIACWGSDAFGQIGNGTTALGAPTPFVLY